MADAKTSTGYNKVITDNSANDNAANLKLSTLVNMGLPEEAYSSGKINIKNPKLLANEEDQYGYYLNNLLNNLKGFGTA